MGTPQAYLSLPLTLLLSLLRHLSPSHSLSLPLSSSHSLSFSPSLYCTSPSSLHLSPSISLSISPFLPLSNWRGTEHRVLVTTPTSSAELQILPPHLWLGPLGNVQADRGENSSSSTYLHSNRVTSKEQEILIPQQHPTTDQLSQESQQ